MAPADKKTYDEKHEYAHQADERNGGRRLSTAEEVTMLSEIEATAASKAAWLISVTVSLGGFLFGPLRSTSLCQVDI